MNQSSDKQLLEIIEKYLRNIATDKPIEKENSEFIEKKETIHQKYHFVVGDFS